MDRGAWRATVHGVTKSQTQLSNYHTHTREESDTPEQTCKFFNFCLFIVNLLKCQSHRESQRAFFFVYNFIF